jgi:hypothetical protein
MWIPAPRTEDTIDRRIGGLIRLDDPFVLISNLSE